MAPLLGGVEPFVQISLVDGTMRNNSVNLF